VSVIVADRGERRIKKTEIKPVRSKPPRLPARLTGRAPSRTAFAGARAGRPRVGGEGELKRFDESAEDLLWDARRVKKRYSSIGFLSREIVRYRFYEKKPGAPSALTKGEKSPAGTREM